MNKELEYKIKTLPDSPGCYLMKNKGKIIYVGKAKNLKNRVRQYFHSTEGHTPKVRAMVSNIDDFDILLCRTNFEALTLECNLIKKHNPFYNILLKDGKQYPFIRYDLREPFPKLTVARQINQNDGCKYLGPYISATAVWQVLRELGRYFPLRRCSQNITVGMNRRPCVYHSTGQCLAPCASAITSEDYMVVFYKALAFLNGDAKDLIKDLKQKMNDAAKDMQYEQAAAYRDKLMDVEAITEKQLAIQTKKIEQDVIAVAISDDTTVVQILHIHSGKIEEGKHYVFDDFCQDSPGEAIESFITQYYGDIHKVPREVVVQAINLDSPELEQWLRQKRDGAVDLIVPQRGEKKALVEIAKKNAQDALNKITLKQKISFARTTLAMQELKDALNLPTMPKRIEGYDISNTQGVLSVASMVVFHDAKPANKQYRHFRIKTVEGANDFASMAEVITRRFTHGLQEKHELTLANKDVKLGKFSYFPDVILIDGGKGQLAFAHKAMLDAGVNIPMFGLAKKFEEIYLPNQEQPIILPRKGNALHLVQSVRDEAHRFGITHHRSLRAKATITSELASIKGIGQKRQIALMREFGTLEAVFSASLEKLSDVQGMNKASAQAILDYVSKKQTKKN